MAIDAFIREFPVDLTHNLNSHNFMMDLSLAEANQNNTKDL